MELFYDRARFEPASLQLQSYCLSHSPRSTCCCKGNGAVWASCLTCWGQGCPGPAAGTWSRFSAPVCAAHWGGSGCILPTSASPRGAGQAQVGVVLGSAVSSEATGAAAPARSRPVGRKSWVRWPGSCPVAAASSWARQVWEPQREPARRGRNRWLFW